MHDTDSFGRMPALDLSAAQPPLSELILVFEKEVQAPFQNELYRVRDNGAVYRCVRPGGRRRRPLDEVWTFGSLNRHSGYFEIAGHVVHRIVATAFHGACPSAEHVVDHIDTNRLNNRPDNLRWVTRLENILLNPITRARIELAYGSLEAFFANPGASTIPQWEWMRVVTKEQAEASRQRLLAWAQTAQNGKGGKLDDWLFKPAQLEKVGASPVDSAQLVAAQREALSVPTFDFPVSDREVRIPGAVRAMPVFEPQPLDTESLTASAFQRKWRTPTEFPQCPTEIGDEPLADYLGRLSPGAVFTRSRYGENLVLEAAIGPGNILSVVSSTPPGSVKGWARAQVFVEGEKFCHESCGTFFAQEGAMKAHCMAIGAPYEHYGESIDDYC
ncbi:HNH endonuclease [Sinorhizobium meliloti]|uniref:HNH endonuclease signature motif containing protein n=1 Tax=Rhizobium meliloti TaxID=382 RepID=UPI001294A3BF|nr:HNH endonuclease signature motif containing protein [Sinorhizobium meliloti]MDW9486210.1 HNH endonuclease [Sinorhizobium meliloti]MDW9605101.1 HNH endonuclease [Sinorhizobium meliloti]MDW9675200.1 HNH endonuclease [Sinorhizobium meliloti]MDW9951851.1 HNH endonuclease [Sinorhizobium meliloti]MDX0386810.1 HNH endonuclease [Sinorhizobium meliloti]